MDEGLLPMNGRLLLARKRGSMESDNKRVLCATESTSIAQGYLAETESKGH